eukprot:11188064-Lingulodinium_polyedra.AAC.1
MRMVSRGMPLFSSSRADQEDAISWTSAQLWPNAMSARSARANPDVRRVIASYGRPVPQARWPRFRSPSDVMGRQEGRRVSRVSLSFLSATPRRFCFQNVFAHPDIPECQLASPKFKFQAHG